MWKSEKLGKVHFERKKSSWIKYVKKCERGKNTPQVCQKNEIKTVEDFSSCRIVSKVQKSECILTFKSIFSKPELVTILIQISDKLQILSMFFLDNF